MSKYLKLFIVMGVPFGVFMGAFNFFSFTTGLSAAVFTGIAAGLFFGVSMSGAFAIIGRLSGEGVAYGKTIWSQIMELQIDSERAEDLCRHSLETVNKKYKFEPSTMSPSQIIARTGMTWRSWGEVISFQVWKLPDSSVKIEISSKPKLRMTKLDWGANRKNIEAICRFIESAVDPEKIIRSERIEPQ